VDRDKVEHFYSRKLIFERTGSRGVGQPGPPGATSARVSLFTTAEQIRESDM
jgi:hypothetical protein